LVRRALFFDHAWLPSGFARNVRVDIEDGIIRAVTPCGAWRGAERIAGVAVPGMPNLHSHAFQRGMAGLSERRGPAVDSFWTWREVMYGFLATLTPEDVEAIAGLAYIEMLEAGFTAVAEFHYLHHDVDGGPYADLGEMAARIAAAAQTAGIGLTLLPAFYAYGGFGGAAPTRVQRRFLNSADRFLALADRTREIVSSLTGAKVGIAPHSLHAVTPQVLREILDSWASGPVHMHAAEQIKEVDECVAALGCRPVEWLLANADIGPRWCLVHATHMTDEETRRLAASRAVAGLCPLTEASLGDGIFNGATYLAAGGRFGIGSDSNIAIDVAAELRQLEYSQRLRHCARNVMTTRAGESTGARLFGEALAAGAQAVGQPIGAIAPGMRADIVLLDSTHPDLAAVEGAQWLDSWIFATTRPLVATVLVGGQQVVEHGRHRKRDEVSARYRRVVARLRSA
jgi:formimidoylglutamate deiminase